MDPEQLRSGWMDPDKFLAYHRNLHRRRQNARVAILLIWLGLCVAALVALVMFWSRV